MIISRTPFRVSFVGGGTDLKEFYAQEEGQVLSTAINKYVYVVVKRQIGIVEYKYRINWSQVEFKNKIEEIDHPIVREALKIFNIDFPIEVTTFADVPAGTGLGSSSSFAVGLVHALSALKGEMITKAELASMAGNIEVDILGRTMGKQDHYAAAYGNINVIKFHTDSSVSIEPVFHSPETAEKLADNLMIFYTEQKRDASEVLKKQATQTAEKIDSLREMKNLVEPLRNTISSENNLGEFGRILHRNWQLKRSITSEISTKSIDQIYEKAREAGAIGGKILGAGGGGFLLFYVEKNNQNKVRDALSDLFVMPIRVDKAGSRITYYDN